MARGNVILYHAWTSTCSQKVRLCLAEKRIAGAAIDVFEKEPVAPDNPLLKLDNVILAPHAICHTDECMSLLGQGAFKAVVDLAHGRKPHLIVNTEVLKHPPWAGKFHA